MDNKKGFTLVEVLIATVIMVSALGALVYGLSQCTGLTETVRNQDIASNALQEKLEEIANSDLSQIMDYDGQTFNITGLTPDPAGSVTVARVGSSELYDVTVTLTWEQRGPRTMSRTLTTTLVQI